MPDTARWTIVEGEDVPDDESSDPDEIPYALMELCKHLAQHGFVFAWYPRWILYAFRNVKVAYLATNAASNLPTAAVPHPTASVAQPTAAEGLYKRAANEEPILKLPGTPEVLSCVSW